MAARAVHDRVVAQIGRATGATRRQEVSMVTRETTRLAHVEPGTDVYDVAAHKLGTVAHVHEPAGTGGDEENIEIRTGFLGLGRHLFVPRSAVQDVTSGGVFLSVTREDIHERGWDQPPHIPAGRTGAASGAPPETPLAASERAAGMQATWEAAQPRYRVLWLQRHAEGTHWETYEARYRFTWELTQLPELAGRTWPSVEPELRRRWEVLHADTEWATVAGIVREAWELPAA
jgi:hypothetical protein